MKNQRIFLIGGFCLAALVIGAGVFFKFWGWSPGRPGSKTETLPPKTEERSIVYRGDWDKTPDKEIGIIGEEKIFGADFNFWRTAYLGRWQTLSPDQAGKEIWDLIEKQSILLQEAAKAGLVKLEPSFFNNALKDYAKRNKIVADLEEKLKAQNQDSISFERLTVFFNNYPERQSLSLEERKTVAYQRLSSLREQVAAGKMTMFEAGQELKKDSAPGEVDVAWKENAYFKVENQPKNEGWFADPAINQEVGSLAAGEISPILTGKSTESKEEIYFTFLKVNQKKAGIFKDEYEVKVF